LPSHIRLKFGYKAIWKHLFFSIIFSRIIFLKKIKKLFYIIITIFIIKIYNECDRCYCKNLYLFCLTINLKIFNKGVFSCNFFIKLKMINNFLFRIKIHFLIIMLIFIENPLEIRYTLPKFYLFPNLPVV
jgi:hypothetical protein